jgi:DNA-binding MarR family transcriptional regulator
MNGTEYIGIRIMQVGRVYEGALRDALAPVEPGRAVSVARWLFLRSLAAACQTAAEVASVMGVTPQSVSSCRRDLEELGWIMRMPRTRGGAFIDLAVTPEGARVLVKADAATRKADDIIGRALGAFPAGDLAVLLGTVERALGADPEGS